MIDQATARLFKIPDCRRWPQTPHGPGRGVLLQGYAATARRTDPRRKPPAHAVQRHGPPPLIIVDLGTALVFDAVSKEGDYLGGALAPGIHIAAEALSERAAKLYPVELTRPPSAIGKNTVSALQSGLLFGYVGLIEGMVARFKEELGGSAKVVGTGGWADIIGRETEVFDEVDPDLTLHGVRLINESNKE